MLKLDSVFLDTLYNDEEEYPDGSVVGAIVDPNDRAEVANGGDDVEVNVSVLYNYPVGLLSSN